MSWFRRDKKDDDHDSKKRLVVATVNPAVGDRLDHVAARLELVTEELERKIARLREEHKEGRL